MKVKVAFYKGSRSFFGRLIKIWTGSPYSHVEIIHHGLWYSSSEVDGGVVKRKINYKPENWDMLTVDTDEKFLREFYKKTSDADYDWFGIIFSQFIRLRRHSHSKYFCSEWCAEALKIAPKYKGNVYSPGKLYKAVKDISC